MVDKLTKVKEKLEDFSKQPINENGKRCVLYSRPSCGDK